MRFLARLLLRLLGWRLVEHLPPGKRYVLIGAPHTSNWDFLFALLGLWALGIRGRWLGKKELFRSPPLGFLLRALGGISVDRSRRTGLVEEVAELLKKEDLVILITPEGTRAQAPYWRSGFYHMARAAGVPIAFGYLDAKRKELGVGGYLQPSGNLLQDFAQIRAFYQDKVGLKPHKQGPIRLREEAEMG
ncbi:1-acyl-sn-glycerol-3-phosphate acyltransferase [Thermus oshimai]|uniref:1-acyl-sn-glycerol-3-phosphate acyltransferase n=1 Tax=Thermus oshimai TaxID=56957 RepID=UPI00037EC303|nr:1-acyl-sn-glycerol-3-phosphate acyltransferase [Thermus oshimai]